MIPKKVLERAVLLACDCNHCDKSSSCDKKDEEDRQLCVSINRVLLLEEAKQSIREERNGE